MHRIPTPIPVVGAGRQKGVSSELWPLLVLGLCLSRMSCWANIQLPSPKNLRLGLDRSGDNFTTIRDVK